MLFLQNRDSLFSKPKTQNTETKRGSEGIEIFKTETHHEMRSR